MRESPGASPPGLDRNSSMDTLRHKISRSCRKEVREYDVMAAGSL